MLTISVLLHHLNINERNNFELNSKNKMWLCSVFGQKTKRMPQSKEKLQPLKQLKNRNKAKVIIFI